MGRITVKQWVLTHPHFSFFLLTGVLCGALIPLLLSLSNLLKENSQNKEKKPELSKIYLSAAQLDHSLREHEVYSFTRSQALDDPYNRISKEFKIPKQLKSRTKFWFDIYSLYSKNHHVIHNSRFPWIIYEVVDTSHFLNGKGPLWLKQKKALKYVASRKKLIRKALASLSKKKSFRRLKPLERKLYKILKKLPGSRKKIHKQARKFLRVQLGQKDFFLRGLNNSNKYMKLIENEFAKLDLPIELTRLPFVESSFNEKAQSRVGASGIWQIMPRVGRRYSIVNKYIDERNSPIKASRIAGKLLKQNFKSLKSWPLAVTAYNNGIGNLKKAIRRSRSRKLSTIIARIYRGAFKFASANFYTSFLAALYVEKYHNEVFNDIKMGRQAALNKVKYKLTHRWRPKTLAKKMGIKLQTLLNYNLDLKKSIAKNRLLPKGFTLYLPAQKAAEFKTQLL